MKTIMMLFLSAFLSLSVFAQSHDSSWKVVKNEEVCMVTEAFFGKKQIPVEVNGKTYYGCCEGCKRTLNEKQAAREAIDPLTKKKVDKATATIAADRSGRVMYFENKKNFEEYMHKLHH